MNDRRRIIRVGSGLLALDVIAPEAELTEVATADDLRSVEGFTSSSRRSERLAWRTLLRSVVAELSAESAVGELTDNYLSKLCAVGTNFVIEYSTQGVPHIKNNSDLHISVSHCRDMVVVAVSESVCGVDVERLDRNFERASKRYMTSAERALAVDAAPVVWCAKECLYKMYGSAGMDFLRDIRITNIDFRAGMVEGVVFSGTTVPLRLLQPDEEHIILYAI